MRSLGRLGVAVHWVHPPARAAAAWSRYARGTVECDASASNQEVIERLVGLSRTLGGRPILIPTDDLAVYLVDDEADRLRECFLFPDQPRGLARQLSDKRAMHALCVEHGVSTPETLFPRSNREALQLADDLSFPVVLKGIDTTVLGEQTGARMAIVRSPEELAQAYATFDASEAGPGLMVQEYIPGPPHSVWMFNGYFDDKSRCLFGVSGRKLRQSPPYTGATSLGVCYPNPAVVDATVRLMDRVGYRGILDIGYRFDDRDGRYKLLDVNPRLGATFRLFTSAEGLDVVRALYLDLSGHPCPSDVARHGRKWLLETSDVASAWKYRRDGRLTVRDWVRSLRGVEEAGWFAGYDPLPCARAYGSAILKSLRANGKGAALAGER